MKLGQKKGEPPTQRVSDMYESRLVKMLASGCNQSEMAEAINLEPMHVEKYMLNYRKKYGAKNSPHLVSILHKLGKL